jgi:hypothetical protein
MTISANPDQLPSLESVFGTDFFRLHGVSSWEQLPALGTRNQQRILALAQEQCLLDFHQDNLDRQEQRQRQLAIQFLKQIPTVADELPVLPRLRLEHFQRHDTIRVFVGDTPGVFDGVADDIGWVQATITKVEKGFRAEWQTVKANSGFFWLSTATILEPRNLAFSTLQFTTSEPRVFKEAEWQHLISGSCSSTFLEVLIRNAQRDWLPYWFLERKLFHLKATSAFPTWLQSLPARSLIQLREQDYFLGSGQ